MCIYRIILYCFECILEILFFFSLTYKSKRVFLSYNKMYKVINIPFQLIIKFRIHQYFFDSFIYTNSYNAVKIFTTLNCLNFFPLFPVKN